MSGRSARSKAPRRRQLLWLPFAAASLCLGVFIWLASRGCPTDIFLDPGNLILWGIANGVLGALIIHYRPENRVGYLLLVVGLSGIFRTLSDLYMDCHRLVEGLPAAAIIAWVGTSLVFVALSGQIILLLHWFPDGQFLSKRWRQAAVISLVPLAAVLLLALFSTGTLENESWRNNYPVDNPFGIMRLSPRVDHLVRGYGNLTFIAATLVAGASLLTRWRRSTGDTRQQLKWLAYFLAIVMLFRVIGIELLGNLFIEGIFDSPLYVWTNPLVLMGFPAVIGLAVFKYRLYDIDLIIKRTLVYGGLSLLLAALYFGSVAILQSLFAAATGQRSPVALVLSTLFIAALFSPLRRYLQRIIDRRFYRQKYDAAQSLEAFARVARDEVDLERLSAELIRVVDGTVQPAHLSLWLRDDPAP